ncbi:MAG: DUF2785 domain-containing protein [Pseudomonadota bacterium]
MRRSLTIALTALACASATASAACPPRAELAALKAAAWQVSADSDRNVLAIAMADCLREADPVLRDDYGFEALSAWMRADKLSVPTVQALRATLQARLDGPDPQGFARPFAALVLSEVARVDRLHPYLSPAQRAELTQAAARYLSGVRDYRGFDEREGWRHGVAHAADLMMQLALNPALGKAEHEAILAAIASQVAAKDGHFYRYGEGERLMAPVFYLARRDTLSVAEWDAWFARLPSDKVADKPDAPITEAALALRHNLKGFLYPLYTSLAESADAAQRGRILPFVTRTLKQLN